MWLWCRLATVALIRPLAWELPYATGAALKSKKKKKIKNPVYVCVTEPVCYTIEISVNQLYFTKIIF